MIWSFGVAFAANWGTGNRELKTERIAALLQPFLAERTLPEVSLQQISTYIDLLLRWNARINLTAVRKPEEIVTRHFGESLFLARHVFVERTFLSASPADTPSTVIPPEVRQSNLLSTSAQIIRVIDIGSGAGFPGLPLKIWAPEISLTLIESNHKKAVFLREMIRALTLTNVNVITERAETIADGVEAPRQSSGAPRTEQVQPADLVTFRAVERFESILPVAAWLVKPSGRLALLIGSKQLPTLETLSPKFRPEPPIPIPGSQARVLSILVRHKSGKKTAI